VTLMNPCEIINNPRSDKLMEYAKPIVESVFKDFNVVEISKRCGVRGFYMEGKGMALSVAFGYNELYRIFYNESLFHDTLERKIRNAIKIRNAMAFVNESKKADEQAIS
jgi:hypothetical protein